MIIQHEQYTLVLRHEYIDQDGQHHNLENPIAVSYSAADMDERSIPPLSFVINEMMERMRMYIIERWRQDEGIEHI